MNWIERHRLFESVHKVRNVIRSCATYDQLKSAETMADNLVNMQPECDEKHIANCFLMAEIGKKIIHTIKSELLIISPHKAK